jgi:hypothetical protein
MCRPSTDLRFQILTAASMKMAVVLVVAPCNLVEGCLLIHCPDDGGSKQL